MSLTTQQLQTLKAAILAETDPGFVFARTNGQTPTMSAFFNGPSTFIVWRSAVPTAEVGKSVNYQAVAAMTTANRDRIITFYTLNPLSFAPSVDIRSFWDSTFSGALDGQGQATRDALQALWRRQATRAEALFAIGTGTTLAPGVLVFEGSINDAHISAALGS